MNEQLNPVMRKVLSDWLKMSPEEQEELLDRCGLAEPWLVNQRDYFCREGDFMPEERKDD